MAEAPGGQMPRFGSDSDTMKSLGQINYEARFIALHESQRMLDKFEFSTLPDALKATDEAGAQAVRAEVLRWRPMATAPKDREIEVKYDGWRRAPVTWQHDALWRTPESGSHKYISEERCSGWRDIE